MRLFKNGFLIVLATFALFTLGAFLAWCTTDFSGPGALGPVAFGPGAFDYEMDIINGYTIFRPHSARYIHYESRVAVDADVVQLGWDDRFILCKQYDGYLSKWLIVDTQTHRMYREEDQDSASRKVREMGALGEINVYPVPATSQDKFYFGHDDLHKRKPR